MKTLEITYTTSKAKNSYGWNRVSLLDGDKKFSTCGGGYDMLGTVFAEWLTANYMPLIIEKVKPDGQPGGLYGLSLYNGKYYLDGACGLDCMKTIAKVIGLQISTIYNKRKRCTTHFIINEAQQ